jgi:hypothetical protein
MYNVPGYVNMYVSRIDPQSASAKGTEDHRFRYRQGDTFLGLYVHVPTYVHGNTARYIHVLPFLLHHLFQLSCMCYLHMKFTL